MGHRLLYKWTEHVKSPSITTDPQHRIQNQSKLFDFVIIIKLTSNVMPRFSNFLRNSIIHFQMFSYLVTCFLSHGFVAIRLQAVSKIHVPIYPYLISEGDEIIRPCYRHRNETAILRKHVTKFKYIRKWMVEFLSKFENRGNKIARVNSILITISICAAATLFRSYVFFFYKK